MSTASAPQTAPVQPTAPQNTAQMPNIPKEDYVGSGAIVGGIAYGGATYLGADLAHKSIDELGWFKKEVEKEEAEVAKKAKPVAIMREKLSGEEFQKRFEQKAIGEYSELYSKDGKDVLKDLSSEHRAEIESLVYQEHESQYVAKLDAANKAAKEAVLEATKEAEKLAKEAAGKGNKWTLVGKIALGVLVGGYGVIKALSAKGQHDMLEAQRNEAVANNFMVVGEANKQLQSAGEQLHVLQQEKSGLEQQVAAHKTWADKVGKGEPSHANSLESMLHDAAAHAHPAAHSPVASHPAAIGDHTSALAHASAPAHDTALGHAAQHAPAADTHAGDIAHAKATAPAAAHQFG